MTGEKCAWRNLVRRERRTRGSEGWLKGENESTKSLDMLIESNEQSLDES